MINKFCKTPLYMCSTTLVDVAMGRKPADLVIKNARLIFVCTREILDGMGGVSLVEFVEHAFTSNRPC